MKLSDMMTQMSPKIASEAPKPTAKTMVEQPLVEKTAGSKSALDAALADTLRSLTTSTKVASVQPEGELEKMAAAVIASDKSDEAKHAELVGQSMAHGFLATLDQFGAAAGNLNKQASEDITAEEIALVKMARANPQAFLEEVARGAAQGGSDKAAEEQLYAETHDRVVAGIHKLSADHYMGGYTGMSQVLAS